MSALTPAHSHWIQSYGYSNGVMTLITKTGEAYAATIPESRYSEFLKAPSQGSFFNLYIKPFATVTKVDVAEAVALVEKAKVAVASTAVPKASRKTPAKSKLPTEPWNGKDSAWIDFRCIADPTTDPDLVKALKRYIELKGADRKYYDYLPYTSLAVTPPAVAIAALDHWGKGYVNPKYLKAMPKTADYRGLAKAYRSAYRSWVKRQEAKKAKGSVVKMIETAAKEVFAGGWGVEKTKEQVRAEKAEAVLYALEVGDFTFEASLKGVKVHVWRGPTIIASFTRQAVS